MSTQRKDQSRSAKLGLDTLWAPQVLDDAADRIVAAGFWRAAPPVSGRVVAFRRSNMEVDGAPALAGVPTSASLSPSPTPVL